MNEPTLIDATALSLRIALAATLLAAAVAIPLAFWLTRRRPWGRTLIDAILTAPLVLPPTVIGYVLLRLLGTQSALGSWLLRHFDYRILFSEEGAILAAFVVAVPLLYLPAKAGFAGVDREMEDVARLFGANTLQIFWHVSLPLARRAITSGLLLAFARALGEFGATVMVLGTSPSRQTLPIRIYLETESGQTVLPVLAMIGISLAVVYVYNRSGVTKQD
jgi:molybdate transport system permease protein